MLSHIFYFSPSTLRPASPGSGSFNKHARKPYAQQTVRGQQRMAQKAHGKAISTPLLNIPQVTRNLSTHMSPPSGGFLQPQISSVPIGSISPVAILPRMLANPSGMEFH